MAKIEFSIVAKDQASKTLKSVAGSFTGLNQSLELFSKLGDAVSSSFNSIVGEGREFSKQMSAVASVSKDVQKNMGVLSEEAKRIGEVTSFSAVQAGVAMENLARSGQSAGEIIKTTASAMDLAAATGSDLGSVSEVIALQMNAFAESGLTANKAANLITQTVGASAQNFSHLNEALKKASPIASSIGMSFDELTIVLGALANEGQRGEVAGTALNGAISRLIKPTKEVKDALTELNLSVEDVNPTANSFKDILIKLNKAGADEAQILSILGQEAGTKFVSLIKKGESALKKFETAQKNANTASQAASIRLDNLDGDLTKFNSALSGLKIKVFESLDIGLRKATQSGTNWITSLSSNFNQFKKILGEGLIALGQFLAPIETSFIQAFSPVLEVIKNVAKQFAAFFNENKEGIQSLIARIVEFAGIIAQHISGALEVFSPFAVFVGEVLVDSFNFLLAAINPILRALIPVKDVLVIISKLTFSALTDAWRFLKDVIKKLGDYLYLTFKPEIDGIVGIFNRIATAVNKVKNAISGVSNPFRKLKELFTGSNEEAKGLEETLTGNTLAGNPDASLETTTKSASKLSDGLIALGKNLKKSGEEGQKADKKFKQVLKNEAVKAATGGTASRQRGITGPSAAVPNDSNNAVAAAGRQIAQQIVGVSGAIQGFQTGGAVGAGVGAFTEILLANKKMQALIGRINEVLIELLDPVVEAIVPLVDALIPFLRFTKPIFKAIGAFISNVSSPFIAFLDIAKDFLPNLGPIMQSLTALLSITYVSNLVLTKISSLARQISWKINFRGLINLIDKVFRTVLVPGLSYLKQVFEFTKSIPPVKTAIDKVSRFTEKVSNKLNYIDETYLNPLKESITDIRNYIFLLLEDIGKIVEKLNPLPAIKSAVQSVKTAVTAVKEKLVDIHNKVRSLVEIKNNIRQITVAATTASNFLMDIKKLLTPPSGGGGSVGNFIQRGAEEIRKRTGIFHSGGLITDSTMLRMPGMNRDEGLIKVQRGERVLSRSESSIQSPVNIVINVQSINPQAQKEEIREVMEELFLTRRLQVA